MAFLPKLGRSALPPLRQAPCQEDEGHDLCDAARSGNHTEQQPFGRQSDVLCAFAQEALTSRCVQLFEFSAPTHPGPSQFFQDTSAAVVLVPPEVPALTTTGTATCRRALNMPAAPFGPRCRRPSSLGIGAIRRLVAAVPAIVFVPLFYRLCVADGGTAQGGNRGHDAPVSKDRTRHLRQIDTLADPEMT
ncbi:MAG TPA: hypothetical protein VD995_22875 [Azospirillum sp.]|nr:hypothetical protein [Azospirillum sp.]